VVTFALYALLVKTGVNYNISLTVTYLLGIALGFSINRWWTFSSNSSSIAHSQKQAEKSTTSLFTQYLLVYAVIFSVNVLILNALVQIANFNPVLAQLIAVGFSTICSFILQKKWVFKS